MRKILVILFYILSLSAFGQGRVRHAQASGASSPYTSEFQDVLDTWASDPTGDTLLYLDSITIDLATLWPRIDGLYVTAINNRDNAGVNWINPGDTTDIDDGDTISFTAYEGWAGDGTNDYLDPNMNFSYSGWNWALDSATIGGYVLESVNANESIGGVIGPDHSTWLNPRYLGNMYSRINRGSSHETSNSSSQGMALATRRSGGDVENYMNGSSLGSGTIASNTVVDNDLWLLAINNQGAIASPASFTLSIVIIMDGITDAEAQTITDAFEKYLDYIGAGVIP